MIPIVFTDYIVVSTVIGIDLTALTTVVNAFTKDRLKHTPIYISVVNDCQHRLLYK